MPIPLRVKAKFLPYTTNCTLMLTMLLPHRLTYCSSIHDIPSCLRPLYWLFPQPGTLFSQISWRTNFSPPSCLCSNVIFSVGLSMTILFKTTKPIPLHFQCPFPRLISFFIGFITLQYTRSLLIYYVYCSLSLSTRI